MRAAIRCAQDASADEVLMCGLAMLDAKEGEATPLFLFLYYKNIFCNLFACHSWIARVDGAQKRQAPGVSVPRVVVSGGR